MSSVQLILGIGSGRCGTRTLASILDQQPGARVTHEIRPVLSWTDAQATSRIAERITALRFQGQGQRLAGDVAHYYLNYIEQAISLEPTVRVVCLKRPRNEVVESYFRWVRTMWGPDWNHWVDAERGWKTSAIWSDCFPSYETDDMRDAIGRYWDEYYSTAERLRRQFRDNVRIFDMRRALNSEAGQRELLNFVGIPADRQQIATDVVLNSHAEGEQLARQARQGEQQGGVPPERRDDS